MPPSCITESGIIGISFGIENRGTGVGTAEKLFVPGMEFGDFSMVGLGAGAFSFDDELPPSPVSNMLVARFRNGTQSL